MRLIIHDTDRRYRLKACGSRLLLSESGPSCVQGWKQTHHPGAKTASVALSHPVNPLCHGTGAEIGRGAHGRPLPSSRQGIHHKRTVPHGIDIGKIGLHFLIHQNRSLYHFQAGLRKKTSSRTHANGQNHQIRRKRSAVRNHAFGALPAFDPLKTYRSQNPHSGRLHLTLRIARHLLVKGVWHNLGSRINHGNIHFERQKVLSHLQSDKARTADHRSAAFLFLRIGADGYGVIRGPDAEHARKILSFHRGNERHRAGCDNQFVIGFLENLSLRTADGHLFTRTVKPDGLAPGPHAGSRKACVFFRRIDNQFLSGGNIASDVIGQPAARIGDILALCKNLYLGLPVEAL